MDVKRALLLLMAAAAGLAQSPSAEFYTGLWRGQVIEYRIMDGWALIHGDILLDRLEAIQPLDAAEIPVGKLLQSVVVEPENRRWPGAIVHYVIDSAMRNPNRAVEAMRHWEERTPFRFVERTTEAAFVRIRSVDSGCSAGVGRIGGEQHVNLADSCGVATTIHELGHTLGFWHTQSRLDRDRHVRVRYENIERGAWGQYDTRLSDGEDLGPYDYGSIMHYSDRGFARTPKPTIQSIPLGIPLGAGSALTPADVAAAHQLAGKEPPRYVITTTPPGLRIFVDGEAHTSPAAFQWTEGGKHRIAAPGEQTAPAGLVRRLRFAGWSSAPQAGTEVEITAGSGVYVFNARYQQMAKLNPQETPGGSVEVWPASEDGYYPAGTEIRLTAHAHPGMSFHRWQDQGRDGFSLAAQFVGWSANPLTVLIDRDLDISALFTDRPLTTITSTAPHLGMVVDNARIYPPASFAWEAGSAHEISAPEQANTFVTSIRHRFQSWSHGAAARHTYTAGASPATLAANYQSAYSLFAREGTASTPGNVRLTPSAPDGWYEHGLQLTVEGLDTPTARFLHWGGDLGGAQNPVTLTLEQPLQFFAIGGVGPGVGAASFVHGAAQQPGPIAPGQPFVFYRHDGDLAEPASAAYWEGRELPTELAGTRALLNGHAAGLLEVNSRAIIGIAPAEIAGARTAFVTVLRGSEFIGQRFLPVTDSAPGVFARDGSGQGDAWAWNEDWVENSAGTPAGTWKQFHFLATGFGATDPPESPRQRTQPVRPVCEVGVELGMTRVEVTNIEAYQDLPPGVFRIWARVPPGMKPGRHMLFATCDGRPSQPGIWLYTE